MSHRVWPDMRIGDIVTSEKTSFGESRIHFIWSKNGISIADIQTKVVKVVTISPIHMSGQAMAHRYHSYYTTSANPIYMDPDYNSPLSYCWGYCNLSIK